MLVQANIYNGIGKICGITQPHLLLTQALARSQRTVSVLVCNPAVSKRLKGYKTEVWFMAICGAIGGCSRREAMVL
jgi:hypothetical protein